MYSEKFATAIKVAGKVLRESGEAVALPFGSEYSIYLKNMNSVRALVRVEIDGVDATEGTSLIVEANGSVDLERFLKSSNYEEGRKFKFIERTKKIENGPRGVGVEDGLIRIEFEFERPNAPIHDMPMYRPYEVPVYHPVYHTYPTWGGRPWGDILCSTNAVMRGSSLESIGDTTCATGGTGIYSGITAAIATTEPITEDYIFPVSSNGRGSKVETLPQPNEAGITVEGSASDQKFTVGAQFPTDGVKHVMILKLLGQVGKQRVKDAVTVKTKRKCHTCGTTHKQADFTHG